MWARTYSPQIRHQRSKDSTQFQPGEPMELLSFITEHGWGAHAHRIVDDPRAAVSLPRPTITDGDLVEIAAWSPTFGEPSASYTL